MPLKAVKRPAALEDLIEIWEYSFENWGEAQADRYVDGLEHAIERLTGMDGRRSAVQIEGAPYLRVRCQRHQIVFEVLGDTMYVVRVLHSSRDLKRHLP